MHQFQVTGLITNVIFSDVAEIPEEQLIIRHVLSSPNRLHAHLRNIMSRNTVNIAEYLFTRLYQLGVKDLHGVPGDFNLVALDYVEPCGLNWVGNCNELNAGMIALRLSGSNTCG